jgi:hypothetical protein
MTAIIRTSTEQVRRTMLRGLALQWAAAITKPARWLWAKAADAAFAGQLGPDPETEIGRWTGARV